MTEIIIYKTKKPDIKQYAALFESTGWNSKYEFTIKELEYSFDNSWYSVTAYLANNLVGSGRIISDGIHHALIVDLIVLPEYQGKGIGSELLSRLVEKCKECNIRDIQLFSAKDKFKFYEKYNFIKRAENAPGMVLKD